MQQVKDVMTRDVKVISPDATLKEAASFMRDEGFGMMPVGENDRMIGVISDRDIAVRAVASGKGCDTPCCASWWPMSAKAATSPP